MIIVGFRVIWLDQNRFLVACLSLIKSLKYLQRDTAIVVGFSKIRFDEDGPVKIDQSIF